MQRSPRTRVGPRVLLIGLAAMFFVVAGSATAAKPLTVCASGCEYTTITAALADASDGALIVVEAGSYGGFSVDKNVSIRGAGAAETTISGLGSNPNPVVGIAPGASVSIRGVTITGGFGTVSGGINNSGTLTLVDSVVTGNESNGGAGVFNSGVAVLKGCLVSGNSGAFDGGIDNRGSLTLEDTTVSANSGTNGGGLFNNLAATASIERSTISDNLADFSGGGIVNAGQLTLTNSTVSGNGPEPGATALSGGGIENHGTMLVKGTQVSGNLAEVGGGIDNPGTASLWNSSVRANVATDSGGGIANTGSLTLKNTDVSDNTPDDCVGCPF
jgi:hypothetical protein